MIKYCFYFLLIGILSSCNDRLPYDLQIGEIDNIYSVYDKNNYPVLQEGITIGRIDSMPFLKKLLKYSVNEKGLVFNFETTEKKILYVYISSNDKYFYDMLKVNYTVFTKEVYKKMNMDDHWTKIRYE